MLTKLTEIQPHYKFLIVLVTQKRCCYNIKKAGVALRYTCFRINY